MLDMVLQTSKVPFVPKCEAKDSNGENFYIQVLLNHSLKGDEKSLLRGVILKVFRSIWVLILNM